MTEWYIVGPISDEMQGKLMQVKRMLTTRQSHICKALNDVAELCGRAAIAYEKGDHTDARNALAAACDLEFKTLGECEASGALSEELFPDDSAPKQDVKP